MLLLKTNVALQDRSRLARGPDIGEKQGTDEDEVRIRQYEDRPFYAC